MNQERIRELLVQCQQESIDGPEYPRWTDQQKFAELVWEEAYQQGFDDGAEQTILKERG